MEADLACTMWLNGWPLWAGGTGTEWLDCCISHDNGGTHWELAKCVAKTSSLMATIMLIGVAGPLGIAYRAIKRWRK